MDSMLNSITFNYILKHVFLMKYYLKHLAANFFCPFLNENDIIVIEHAVNDYSNFY